MNQFRNVLLLFAFIFITSLTSCSKDDATPDERVQLLTAGAWSGNKVYSEGEDVTEDMRSNGFDITTVNVLFKKNGTYSSTFDGSTEEGTWQLISNNSKLLLDGTDELEIKKLDSRSMYLVDTDGFELRYIR